MLERVRRFSPITAYTQSFTEWFTQTFDIEFGVEGFGEITIVTFTGTPATPNNGSITAPLVLIPINDVEGTGCIKSDWDTVDVDGKIGLIKRGTCTFGSKSKIAKARGAVGVIIWNNVNASVTGG